jgi:uncharacterized protein
VRRATIPVAAVVLGFPALVAFALDYPPLTGRVVDQANVISAQSRGALETKLKELEDKSSIQLAVATVKSLQGSDIETYANGLFRSRFKAGDFSGGIERGVDGIINVLSGDSAGWQAKVDVRREDASADFDKLFPFLFFLLVIFICWYLIHHAGGGPTGRGSGRRRGGPIFIPYGGPGWGSGWGGGGLAAASAAAAAVHPGVGDAVDE